MRQKKLPYQRGRAHDSIARERAREREQKVLTYS